MKKDPAIPELSDDDFTIEEHFFSIGSAANKYLIITNESDKTVTILGSADALNAGGETLVSVKNNISVLAPGETSILEFCFDHPNVADIQYSLKFSEAFLSTRTMSVIEDLTFEIAVERDGPYNDVSLTVRNNGEKTGHFIKAYILFFDTSGNVAGVDHGFICDEENELKPGAEITTVFHAIVLEDYSTIGVYFQGYGNLPS